MASSAAEASRKRNPRVTRSGDDRTLGRPAPTRAAEDTITVQGDPTREEMELELRHLHGCPAADPDATAEEKRIESFEVDGHRMWGDAKVPVVYTIVRCISCGESVKSEKDTGQPR